MNDEAEKLFNKALSYKGMLDEAIWKCTLLKNRIAEAKKQDTITDEFIQELWEIAARMKQDVAKYKRKVENVLEKLKSYDIPDVE